LYEKTKEPWLRTFLSLPNGIPSDDTFNRFYSAVEPQQLEDSFISWVKDVSKITDGEIISIDGKSIRGSGQKDSKAKVHMVSAWAHRNHLILAQVKTSEKSNE